MATYNVDITSKAVKSFSDLGKSLVDAHRSFDNTIRPDAIKVITNFLHNNHGNWLYVGLTGETGMQYRFIRIIIDIPAGSKTASEKADLMRRILECCVKYQGKKAAQCEIEVRVNEIDPSNVMRFDGTSGGL